MKTSYCVRAYIGMGANLGDPVANFTFACDRLAALEGTTLVERSSLYRSAPVGVSGEQPDYTNAVVAIDTSLSAGELLQALLEIEAAVGRERIQARAPRALDLDLLLYAQDCIDEPNLQLPHPRMHERAFVLQPLAEIAPTLCLPGHGALPSLLARLSKQRVNRM